MWMQQTLPVTFLVVATLYMYIILFCFGLVISAANVSGDITVLTYHHNFTKTAR